MKSSVDWKSDGRVGLQFCNRKGGVIRKLGGVCGVKITVLNSTYEDVPLEGVVWFRHEPIRLVID
jgi:hypothetical protein